MLEKFIIQLEHLQARLFRHNQRKRHERSLRLAKTEINRLSRMGLL
ncbi:MAG: hypothetical protein ACKN9T_00255 [Candidatus Methylumidiphilus sp.]